MTETTNLKNIVAGKDKCRVFGRLIRLWDARYASTGTLVSIDGILLDDEGTTAQISVPRTLEKEFRKDLAEDNAYIFSGVTAAYRNNKSYTYDHQNYILQFTSVTKVHRLESKGADIPHYSFNFCSFDGLPEKCLQSRPLLDLIGVISDIGPYDFAGPKSKKKNRKIKIRNLDEQVQQIILWDKHGEDFDEQQVITKSKEGVVVVIFAGLTVSSFQGKYEASSSSATRVYIDLDFPETMEYKKYQWEKPGILNVTPTTIGNSVLPLIEKSLNLQEILELPNESFEGGKSYSCIAEVTSLIQSINWYYKACKKCKVGYSIINDSPKCSCAYPTQSAEFKLPVTIKDSSSVMDCIAFYNVAEDLVECSALQASQNMQVEPDNHPPILNTAIGKKRIFHIGISKNISSKFPIKYVLKRSYIVDKDETVKDTPSTHAEKVPQSSANAAATSTPEISESNLLQSGQPSNPQAKRRIDFNQEESETTKGKQQKNQ